VCVRARTHTHHTHTQGMNAIAGVLLLECNELDAAALLVTLRYYRMCSLIL